MSVLLTAAMSAPLMKFAEGAVLAASVYLVSRGGKKWHSDRVTVSGNLESYCSRISWGTGLAKWEQTCFASRSAPFALSPTPPTSLYSGGFIWFFAGDSEKFLLTRWHRK